MAKQTLVSSLKANPRNARKITDKRLDQLAKSMQAHGDLSGVVFNRKTGNLVGGTQRSKKFDKTAEVVITKRFPKPTKVGTVALGYIKFKGERFSYREVEWDKHQEMAASLAANNNAGEWDQEELGVQLKELGSFDVDYDLDLTMFDENEIDLFKTTTVSEHERELPNGNKVIDEDELAKTSNECPSCGFKW